VLKLVRGVMDVFNIIMITIFACAVLGKISYCVETSRPLGVAIFVASFAFDDLGHI